MLQTTVLGPFKRQKISLNNFISFLIKQEFLCLAIFKGQPVLTKNQETMLCFLWKTGLTKLSWPWDFFEVESMWKLSLGTKQKFHGKFPLPELFNHDFYFPHILFLSVERALIYFSWNRQRTGIHEVTVITHTLRS